MQKHYERDSLHADGGNYASHARDAHSARVSKQVLGRMGLPECSAAWRESNDDRIRLFAVHLYIQYERNTARSAGDGKKLKPVLLARFRRHPAFSKRHREHRARRTSGKIPLA